MQIVQLQVDFFLRKRKEQKEIEVNKKFKSKIASIFFLLPIRLSIIAQKIIKVMLFKKTVLDAHIYLSCLVVLKSTSIFVAKATTSVGKMRKWCWN